MFGSEVKALAANPNFQKRINKDIFPEYFTFQNIFSSKTHLRTLIFPCWIL